MWREFLPFDLGGTVPSMPWGLTERQLCSQGPLVRFDAPHEEEDLLARILAAACG